jgi:16S rRNA (cytosine967-C5)-methyltransferase
MGDYLKMLPHKHGTDGFFAAVLERKAEARQGRRRR